MRAQIEVLREVFEEWLRTHDLDRDCWVYSQAEWTAKGETMMADAELVIAFENELVTMLNYGSTWDVESEMQDLAGGFGYYFEIGNVWNIGFYPLEDWPELPPTTLPYAQLLRDARWTAKRERIVRRCAGQCEDCGQHAARLEVHHCYYRFGRHPWQYPDAALLALCRPCHVVRPKVELLWRTLMPRLTTIELQQLREFLIDGLYWFDRSRFFALLDAICDPDADRAASLNALLATWSHPEERGERPVQS